MTATVAAKPAGAALAAAGFDEATLALPFYEPRHAELAARVAAWCTAHRDLLGPSTVDTAQLEPLIGEAGPATVARSTGPAERGRRILRALGEDGLLGFLDPDRGTASDGDLRSLCLAREGLAYADDLADYAFSIQALSATPLLRHGSAEQRARYLPAMAGGELQGAFAISEEQAGSDVAAIATTARGTDDGYLLRGTKSWIANGSTADLFCVVARTGEGPGALGLTAFLVPAGTPGVRVEREVPMIAPRAFAHLAFEDCHLPFDSVLGRPGSGFTVAMDLLDRFRMTVGAAALGFARRAADAALKRARERAIYGGMLFDLATVRATFADIEVKLNAAALLVARAAWECDRGNRRYAKHSSIAKLYATESAQEVVDACVQVFGAAGLVQDSITERLYRQVRSLRIYEGASEIQKTIIAGALDLRRADRVADHPGGQPRPPAEQKSRNSKE